MIRINITSSKPIYEQIIDEIKEEILKGLLQAGDKLPSVRKLSSELLVNPNTVSKAYVELERQKVIETVKGRGSYVSTNYNPKMEEDRIMKLKEDLRKIIIESHYIGIDRKNLNQIIDDIYSEIERK